MAPQISIKLTYEDYAAIPVDGRRHEIIDGEHHVNPAPNIQHQRIVKRIVRALLPFEDAGLGEVLFAPSDVVLSEMDIVQPDVLFVVTSRSHIIAEKHVKGAPDLAVEVLSPFNRPHDERVKLQTYERLGVGEYWIVDPEAGTVTVYRRRADRFVRIDAADPVTTPLLPNFALPLRDLFT